MRNIVLIGMMGCGKTTIGRILSGRLKRPLVDVDELIEAQEGMSVTEIFEMEGEAYFRALEMGVAQALSLRSGLIIACGGGLATQEKAISALKETGHVVWLNRDPGGIYDRGGLEDRPLAQEGREAFLERAAARAPLYRKWADIVVTDFTSPVSTAARILEAVG